MQVSQYLHTVIYKIINYTPIMYYTNTISNAMGNRDYKIYPRKINLDMKNLD